MKTELSSWFVILKVTASPKLQDGTISTSRLLIDDIPIFYIPSEAHSFLLTTITGCVVDTSDAKIAYKSINFGLLLTVPNVILTEHAEEC